MESLEFRKIALKHKMEVYYDTMISTEYEDLQSIDEDLMLLTSRKLKQ